MSETPAGGINAKLVLPRRIIRFGSRIGFVLIAAILLIFTGYRLTQLWLVPEITIAVPQDETEYMSLFSALARVADPITLKVRVSSLRDANAVAKALDNGEVEFAVIRPDLALPTNGLTAAILREDPLLLFRFTGANTPPKIADPKKKVPDPVEPDKKIKSLAGKRIGIVGPAEADRDALVKVLDFHGATGAEVVMFGNDLDKLTSAVVQKEVEVVAVISRPDKARQIVAALADLKPVLLPLNAALAAEMPVFSQATINLSDLHEEFPTEDVKTVAISWRLMARNNVERATVSALLNAIYHNRLALARESDLAWPIKGFEDEGATFSKLPNHRGALDFYNREQQTFMDLYGDWLWLSLFAAGGVSSAFAWLIQVLSRRRKQIVENILDRLLEILREARDAKSIQELDELTLEIDGLVTHAVRQARRRATDPISTTALTLAIDSSRSAIADRRNMLSSGHASLRSRHSKTLLPAEVEPLPNVQTKPL